MIDFADYPNFTEDEMRCSCGCGRADMDPDFMKLLQDIRAVFGHPMPVTSGFRCPSYNERIGGAVDIHPSGKAADIWVSGEPVYHLLAVALLMDVRGIGLKQHGPHIDRFMHLDTTSGTMRPRIWTYT